MIDLHINDFYVDVARIWIQMYSRFPVRTTLYVDEICGPDQPDEFGLHSPRFSACFSTMLWLSDAGYLDFEETVRQEALDQVVLSRSGFLLLNGRSSDLAIPNLADHRVTGDEMPTLVRLEQSENIALLRRALDEQSSSQVRLIVQHLLNQPLAR